MPIQIQAHMKTSKVSSANSKSESLRATIPNDIAEFLELEVSDVLVWESVQDKGKKSVKVRKLE